MAEIKNRRENLLTNRVDSEIVVGKLYDLTHYNQDMYYDILEDIKNNRPVAVAYKTSSGKIRNVSTTVSRDTVSPVRIHVLMVVASNVASGDPALAIVELQQDGTIRQITYAPPTA